MPDKDIETIAAVYYDIGIAYSNQKNYSEAVKWYRGGAEQGNDRSQCNLGICYANGRGVEKDYIEAAKWYRKSAEQGNAVAQCNLGWYYENGRGVTQDYGEAVKWYRKRQNRVMISPNAISVYVMQMAEV